MRRLPLRNRQGETIGHTLVDDEDYELARQHRWHLNGDGYARTQLTRGRFLKLHQLILPTPIDVDHKNRDRLDNRRENLRALTRSEQRQNQTPRGRSPHRGVSYIWNRRHKKWLARVKLDGVYYLNRYFATEEEAALEAQRVRLERMPYAIID